MNAMKTLERKHEEEIQKKDDRVESLIKSNEKLKYDLASNALIGIERCHWWFDNAGNFSC